MNARRESPAALVNAGFRMGELSLSPSLGRFCGTGWACQKVGKQPKAARDSQSGRETGLRAGTSLFAGSLRAKTRPGVLTDP
jgi:hypothetical protein